MSALSNGDGSVAPLGALRRFTREREREATRSALEHCDLCGEGIAPNHQHLLDISSRALSCACRACALLFNSKETGGKKYQLVPRRYLTLPDFQMTDEQWEELTIPVNMVYIFRSGDSVRAFYPSPAGAMESLLNMQSWEELVKSNAILNEMDPDVEALLINRVREVREYFLVPIDACYQLVGLIRTSWRGLSGGEEVWKAIGEFFADVRTKSGPATMRGESDARSEL